MTPLKKLVAFKKGPAPAAVRNKPSGPTTFVWKGETYAIPTNSWRIGSFWLSSRGKAWKAFREANGPPLTAEEAALARRV